MSATIGLHDRAQLLEWTTVRALTGLRRDEIFDRVDGSSLLHSGLAWVFNFAVDPNGKRDLRFWRKEIEGVKSGAHTSHLEIGWVIDRILPKSRSNFHSGEVIQMFSLTRPTLIALRPALNGRPDGVRNVLFARADLAAFLKARWLGAVYHRPKNFPPSATTAASPRAAATNTADTNKSGPTPTTRAEQFSTALNHE